MKPKGGFKLGYLYTIVYDDHYSWERGKLTTMFEHPVSMTTYGECISANSKAVVLATEHRHDDATVTGVGIVIAAITDITEWGEV